MVDVAALIVTALVKAMLAGVQKAAQGAAAEGFAALRRRLAERYGSSVASSIAKLEADPRSIKRQNEVVQRLQEAGAESDPELAALAKGLIDLLENLPSMEASANPDPVEALRHSAGVEAVNRVMQDHVRRVEEVRAHRSIEDVDLLTARIKSNRKLPEDLRASAETLHIRIRNIINQIATSIEEVRYRDSEEAVNQLPTGLAERERAGALVQADKRIHVAYETLRLTVEFFSDLNQVILKSVDDESLSPHKQSNMMFGNAIMIYELTDLIIEYLKDFSLGDEHTRLYADSKERVQKLRDRQEQLRRKVESPGIEPEVRRQTLENIEARETAFEALDAEWERYLDEVRSMHSTVADIQGRVPTLEIIKENAEIQIMTLQLAAMLRFLRQSSESMRGAVETLQGFRLAPLNSTRLRQLLGV